jgi:hypothetical protein
MPWTPEDNLRGKGLHVVRGLGLRIEPGPGIGGHSQLSGPADNRDAAGKP